MFNIFVEERAEKKYCPEMTYYESKDSADLIDWNQIDAMPRINDVMEGMMTNSMIALCYARQNNADDGYLMHHMVIDSKEGGIYLQSHEDYDLIIFMADKDLDGNPIKDIQDRIKGVVKINGRLKLMYSNVNSLHDRKVWGAMARKLVSKPGVGLRIYLADFIKKEKPAKSRRRSKPEPHSVTQPSAAV